MDVFKIESTENSPLVILDPASLKFEIAGESRPENAGKFYDPIIQWLEQFHSGAYWQKNQGGAQKIEFEFKLEYFNSTSAKYILDILKQVDLCHADGCTALINWHYDSRDEDMRESGEEFAQLVNIPFEFISK